MVVHPISTLELRKEPIPRGAIIEGLERLTGRAFTHEERHYLQGQPVHCGDKLELYREGQWEYGRYEWSGSPEDPATFHVGDGILRLDGDCLLRWPEI